MAYIRPKDRVLERSTSNSQSVFTVPGAGVDTSFNAFNAHMSVGDWTFGAVIEAGVAFKAGILTYSATNEITVTYADESKGAFSSGGTKEVQMGMPAQMFDKLYGSMRRNTLLTSINLAKLGAAFYRGDNVFADGFAGTDGISGTSGYTPSAGSLTATPGGVGSRISSGISATAPRGGTAANANNNNGATDTLTSTSGAANWSGSTDANERIFLKYDLGADTPIAKLEAIGWKNVNEGSTGQFWYSTNAQGGGAGQWTKYGADQSLTTSKANKSQTVSITARYFALTFGAENVAGDTMAVDDFNVYGQSSPSNIILLGVPQIPLENPLRGRGILLSTNDMVDTTDHTFELTADNGSTFIAGALSKVNKTTKGASGTDIFIYETKPIDFTGHTGLAGINYRYKTFGGIQPVLYGIGYEWDH